MAPSARQQYYSNAVTFAREQPLLLTFLLPPLLLSLTPLTLFLTFSISTLLFSLLTAAAFILFWVGLAVLVLIPTLFVTLGLGVIVGIWGVCSWLVARWVYGFVFGGGEARNGKEVKVVKVVAGGKKNGYSGVEVDGNGGVKTEVGNAY